MRIHQNLNIKEKLKNGTTIDQRPEIINERKRLGDFGIDLIVGPKNKGAILTVVDRLSRQCIIEKLGSKGSKEIKNILFHKGSPELVNSRITFIKDHTNNIFEFIISLILHYIKLLLFILKRLFF